MGVRELSDFIAANAAEAVEYVVSQVIVGVFLNVAAAFLFVFLLLRYFSPNIKFNERIRKRRFGEGREFEVFQIRFENVGRNAMVDVEIMARGRMRLQPGRIRTVDLKLDTAYIPYIPPRKVLRRSYQSQGSSIRIVGLHPEETSDFKLPYFRPFLGNAPDLSNLTFENVMNDMCLQTNHRGEVWRNTLEIIVQGTQPFGPIRRVFVSKRYTFDDVQVPSGSDEGGRPSFGRLRDAAHMY